MHSIRQLIRQPIKTFLGIAIIAAAVAVLCVCLGQGIAATKTEALLNATFQTAALPATKYTDEADNWALQFAQENKGIVQAVSAPELASAYISGLNPDNYTAHFHSSQNWAYTTQPYDCAMLEITLEEIGALVPNDTPAQNGFSVAITGTVVSVIGLQDDYRDCTGMIARLTLKVPSPEAFAELDLKDGERYLVYCTGYQDDDYLLRSALSRRLGVELQQWHPYSQGIEFFSPEELPNHNQGDTYLKKVGRVRIGSFVTYIYDYQVPMYLSVSGVVYDPAQAAPESLGTEYAHPTMVRLSGTAEAFLSGDEGLLWREALRNIDVNNHAFPIIGVDCLRYLADFLRGHANMETGRDFTDDEIASGANVCIISDTLAEKNGLSIGDTIALQFYDNDESLPYQIDISQGNGNTNPTANYYFANTTPLYDAKEFLIVGIYTRANDWDSARDNLYAFTPNTVFVPRSSIPSETESGKHAFFRTIILDNQAVAAFASEARAQGYGEMFTYFDNGYSAIADGLGEYRTLAKQAFLIGIMAYVVILLLFLMLYPAQHTKTLATMQSFGAARSMQIGHIVLSGIGILIPGTLLGIAAGMAVWDQVAKQLSSSATLTISLQMDVTILASIAAAQLILATVLVLGVGIFATRKTSLMNRK